MDQNAINLSIAVGWRRGRTWTGCGPRWPWANCGRPGRPRPPRPDRRRRHACRDPDLNSRYRNARPVPRRADRRRRAVAGFAARWFASGLAHSKPDTDPHPRSWRDRARHAADALLPGLVGLPGQAGADRDRRDHLAPPPASPSPGGASTSKRSSRSGDVPVQKLAWQQASLAAPSTAAAEPDWLPGGPGLTVAGPAESLARVRGVVPTARAAIGWASPRGFWRVGAGLLGTVASVPLIVLAR